MAFDEDLADRIRDVLASRPELSERKMWWHRLHAHRQHGGGVIGENLAAWVEAGEDYASSLPPKPK